MNHLTVECDGEVAGWRLLDKDATEYYNRGPIYVYYGRADFKEGIDDPTTVFDGLEPMYTKVQPIVSKLGEWHEVNTVAEMRRFYLSRLEPIREAARKCGYAVGVHGSCERDFDLIAVPWIDGAAGRDTLAHEIAMAACGIARQGQYDWEIKPVGRVATSIPICWCNLRNVIGAGHIDLSVMGTT